MPKTLFLKSRFWRERFNTSTVRFKWFSLNSDRSHTDWQFSVSECLNGFASCSLLLRPALGTAFCLRDATGWFDSTPFRNRWQSSGSNCAPPDAFATLNTVAPQHGIILRRGY
jgi:hypothetical protein